MTVESRNREKELIGFSATLTQPQSNREKWQKFLVFILLVDVMGYYILFLKTLSLKLNAHIIHFFYNENAW
uniref:FPL domain-containing protein n=1 Tax=Glossina palpalis gambiensis TaxID=67801 RepID=A0A1B0BG30_9MUSC